MNDRGTPIKNLFRCEWTGLVSFRYRFLLGSQVSPADPHSSPFSEGLHGGGGLSAGVVVPGIRLFTSTVVIFLSLHLI
jgi:hypothetical protein